MKTRDDDEPLFTVRTVHVADAVVPVSVEPALAEEIAFSKTVITTTDKTDTASSHFLLEVCEYFIVLFLSLRCLLRGWVRRE